MTAKVSSHPGSFVSPLPSPDTCAAGDILPASGAFSITLPWPPAILNPNVKKHRYLKRSAAKGYRKACADAAWDAGASPLENMTLASLTFCPPDERKRDEDNARAAFKAGQDGIADALGCDDNTFRPTILWGEPRKGGAVIAHLTPIPG